MGATSFGQTVVSKTTGEGYKELCDKSYEVYGHQDGYNSTISTTDGHYFFDEHPRWGTKAFDKWEDKILDQDGPVQKWKKAGCVEIKGKAAKEIKKVNGLKGKRGFKVFYFFGWAAC